MVSTTRKNLKSDTSNEALPCNTIDKALRSGWKDFEDAVQNYAAVADPEVTAIITRNLKDFQASELEVVDSVDFLPKE